MLKSDQEYVSIKKLEKQCVSSSFIFQSSTKIKKTHFHPSTSDFRREKKIYLK